MSISNWRRWIVVYGTEQDLADYIAELERKQKEQEALAALAEINRQLAEIDKMEAELDAIEINYELLAVEDINSSNGGEQAS